MKARVVGELAVVAQRDVLLLPVLVERLVRALVQPALLDGYGASAAELTGHHAVGHLLGLLLLDPVALLLLLLGRGRREEVRAAARLARRGRRGARRRQVLAVLVLAGRGERVAGRRSAPQQRQALGRPQGVAARRAAKRPKTNISGGRMKRRRRPEPPSVRVGVAGRPFHARTVPRTRTGEFLTSERWSASRQGARRARRTRRST